MFINRQVSFALNPNDELSPLALSRNVFMKSTNNLTEDTPGSEDIWWMIEKIISAINNGLGEK